MSSLRFDYFRCCFILSLLLLLYLAGCYLNSALLSLFRFVLFIVAASVAYLFIYSRSLLFYQRFSNESPSKGEIVTYSLLLQNETFLPGLPLTVVFRQIHQGVGQIPQIIVELAPYASYKFTKEITIPWRGIYTIGLQTIVAQDPLALLSVSLPVNHKTFTVYPQLFPVSLPLCYGRGSGGLIQEMDSGLTSGESFNYLTDYHTGAPKRMIDWKKFATYGQPFIKVFQYDSYPQVWLVVDTRPISGDRRLAAEDGVIESMLSLALFFIRNQVVVRIGDEHEPLRNEHDFEQLFRASLRSEFKQKKIPIDLLTQALSGKNHQVVLISPLSDNYFLNEELFRSYPGLFAVFMTSGFKGGRLKEYQQIGRRLRGSGYNVYMATTPLEIKYQQHG